MDLFESLVERIVCARNATADGGRCLALQLKNNDVYLELKAGAPRYNFPGVQFSALVFAL